MIALTRLQYGERFIVGHERLYGFVIALRLLAVADQKPSGTILVLNCTYENVLIKVVKGLGTSPGRIVAVDYRVKRTFSNSVTFLGRRVWIPRLSYSIANKPTYTRFPAL